MKYVRSERRAPPHISEKQETDAEDYIVQMTTFLELVRGEEQRLARPHPKFGIF